MSTNASNKKRRVTQADVARRAGVSTAVVSATLNPNSATGVRVSQDTAKRVRAVMRELGYTPNPIAQSLARGKRNILGVFTYESVFPSERGNFFYPMLRGIEMQVSGAGYDLLLFTSAQTAEAPRQIFAGGSNRLGVADGAILLGQEPDSSELERLADEGFPFVTVGRRHSGRVELNWAAAGYAEATSEIVSHGHELGHRRIAYVGGATIREQQQDREAGFRSAMHRLGLDQGPDCCWHIDPETLDAACLESILSRRVTLILAETLKHAERLEDLLRDKGMYVPQDMSIAVLGTPLEDTKSILRWTRFEAPREEMGREAVRLLLAQLDGRLNGPAQTTLPCKFIPGDTLRPVTDGH
ncbi:transcriptional regulator, LacI family [Pseudooceanicola antarcticus]|uniref:Transcriptional regulator, LacI family n=1 Tax=Pseudooceanicola antarcticus TaxID=1247613 RepID=A0A285IPE1_9RHOB|nr:LacI family DNA-binding transcriptional regulator [Pseudooceanicola antarcticus]SNY49880.1 transcriptional regulator, LacI family [Pseudooceanicola antarcticus]